MATAKKVTSPIIALAERVRALEERKHSCSSEQLELLRIENDRLRDRVEELEGRLQEHLEEDD